MELVGLIKHFERSSKLGLKPLNESAENELVVVYFIYPLYNNQ